MLKAHCYMAVFAGPKTKSMTEACSNAGNAVQLRCYVQPSALMSNLIKCISS